MEIPYEESNGESFRLHSQQLNRDSLQSLLLTANTVLQLEPHDMLNAVQAIDSLVTGMSRVEADIIEMTSFQRAGNELSTEHFARVQEVVQHAAFLQRLHDGILQLLRL